MIRWGLGLRAPLVNVQTIGWLLTYPNTEGNEGGSLAAIEQRAAAQLAVKLRTNASAC